MFVNHVSLTKDMYPSYIENSQNSVREMSVGKKDNISEHILHNRRYIDYK